MSADATHPIGSREHFLAVYEELKAWLVAEELPKFDISADAIDWIRDSIDYNVPGGKLNRGLSVVHTVQAIRGAAGVTPAEAKEAAVVGWCLEWLQAFFLVADDLMDASPTRRGQPCWYKLPAVGLIAINDSIILQAHIFLFLKRFLRAHPAYLDLVELFNETAWQTELGQLMDLTSQPAPGTGTQVDLDRFTPARWRQIVKHKTAFYSFYMPVVAGMHLAGVATEAARAQAAEILLTMGEYFQAQDDFLDAFAPPEVLGKVGTDIQDNKCSWLVVQALVRASDAQRGLLKANYGRHDEDAIAAVKALYAELGLQALFAAYEQETYETLTRQIAAATATGPIPAEVYLSLLRKIYKRSK